MGNYSYANLEVDEGVVATTTTVSFNLKHRKVVIINDSTTKELQFKFNSSETYGTLKPTETISLELATKTVLLSGNNVPYRVWGIG